jgi:hypothetical protein
VLDFYNPVVVRVTYKTGHTVARDLVLEVDVRHWRTVIVRMEMFLGSDMAELDTHVRSDVLQWLILVVEVGNASIAGCIVDPPVIVGISVRIQSNLLFYIILSFQCSCGQRT